jgi:hypothetical protein
MRPTFTRKQTKLFAAAAVLAFSLPGYSQASNYFVNMTELSSTQLYVSWSLPFYGSFSGTVNAGSGYPDAWSLINNQAPADPDIAIFAENFSSDPGGTTSLPTIMWNDPGDPGKYNVFVIGYSGNSLTEGVTVFSDLSYDAIHSHFDSGEFQGCVSGSVAVGCPFLQNGQTETGIPLRNYTQALGFMDVTFTDQGDVASATPLPAALPLFASGLGALGLLGWRRKRKAALAA